MQQPTLNDSVTAEIRAEMGRQKISQVELARRLNCAQSQLSRRLQGLIPLSTDDIQQIAEALGIPLSQLMSPRQAAS